MKRKDEYYRSKPEALDAYRIGNSIIKENVEKFIKYEKIFILYDERLIQTNKLLNINNNNK